MNKINEVRAVSKITIGINIAGLLTLLLIQILYNDLKASNYAPSEKTIALGIAAFVAIVGTFLLACISCIAYLINMRSMKEATIETKVVFRDVLFLFSPFLLLAIEFIIYWIYTSI